MLDQITHHDRMEADIPPVKMLRVPHQIAHRRFEYCRSKTRTLQSQIGNNRSGTVELPTSQDLVHREGTVAPQWQRSDWQVVEEGSAGRLSHTFDKDAILTKRLPYGPLDQLTIDVLLGARDRATSLHGRRVVSPTASSSQRGH